MKTVMNTFAQRSLRTAVLVGLLGCSGWVLAQAQAKMTAAELTLQTEQLGKQTFKRKSGEVLTFQQIRELPKSERAIVLDDEMSDTDYKAFDKYLKSRTATAEAKTAKTFENLATKTRTVLAAGAKLNISFSFFSESVTTINDDHLKAGLPKEDADFLKSLLKRPELFERP